MLLTITNSGPSAGDLGFLLYKHPDRLQSFPLSFGKAHVFYPESEPEKCTAALLLEVDPIDLVRGRSEHRLDQYVNDRPYASSSYMSVAIAKIFNSALAGKCKGREDLLEKLLRLEARVSCLPCRGNEDYVTRLFEPLGYDLVFETQPLDPYFQDWGKSPYGNLLIRKSQTLKELLTHLYVLIPVLDVNKHYWVGDDEIEKLLKRGEGWLATHPEKDSITRRYLKNRWSLAREALARLADTPAADLASSEEKAPKQEEALERVLSLNEQRQACVLSVLRDKGAANVLDLGCGEGKLLKVLMSERSFKRIVGVDVSHRALERAADRIHLADLPAMQRERIDLLHGSLMYRDKRLAGFDAATVIEVIEHLDAPRLAAFERVLFEFAKPKIVVITTPNSEYNARFENLPAGKFRHEDHRFEWTRSEFRDWASGVANRFGYNVDFIPVGDEDPKLGPPTQMGVFSR